MRRFRRRCPCTPLGKCAVTDAFFRSGPSGTGIAEKSTRHQHPPQAPTRRTAAPIPKARGHRRRRGGHIGQDIARQQRQLREAVAALATEHERPVRADHLLGRQGHGSIGQRSREQTPQGRGRDRQVRRPPQRFLGARVVDHRTPTTPGAPG